MFLSQNIGKLTKATAFYPVQSRIILDQVFSWLIEKFLLQILK
jgi:hypothetical protein